MKFPTYNSMAVLKILQVTTFPILYLESENIDTENLVSVYIYTVLD